MITDIRKLPLSEAILVMNKVAKLATYKNSDIRFDEQDSDWHVMINFSDYSRFKCNGKGNVNDGITDSLYIEYFPPRAGNIRFDIKVQCRIVQIEERDKLESDVIDKLNSLLGKFGGRGMNFVSNFEDLSAYSNTNDFLETEFVNIQALTRRNIIQKFALWLMRISS